MDDLFKKKYRIDSARLSGWDYGSNGLYYVTICTKDRMRYFGEIVPVPNTCEENEDTKLYLSENEINDTAILQPTIIGEIAHANWQDIPNHFPFVELDAFVVMPNHIHAVLCINKPNKLDWQINRFGVQSMNLASVIRGYKTSVKTYATTNDLEFSWQPRYYDHVIRNEKEYLNIIGYIKQNPKQWLLKGDNQDNLYKG
jgi:putative transposase